MTIIRLIFLQNVTPRGVTFAYGYEPHLWASYRHPTEKGYWLEPWGSDLLEECDKDGNPLPNGRKARPTKTQGFDCYLMLVEIS